MTRTLSRIGIAGLVIVLTASLAGCFGVPGGGGGTGGPDPEPSETSGPSTELGLGVPIRVEQQGGVGELTVTKATWSTDAPGAVPAVPAGDHGYLILDATWTTLEGETTIIVNYTMVQDPSGADGEYYLFLQSPLSEVDIPAGQTVTGQIGFEISPGPYRFIVNDEGIGEIASFTFEAEPRESDGT